MTDLTPLDKAHALMIADEKNDQARLGFYERLAESELFLMLAEDLNAADDAVSPEIFELEGVKYVLVFDREERLASFAGQVTPYIAVSGRTIAGMLAGQGIGLGVNLDVAPSSILLADAAVDWLHQTLGNAPDEVEEKVAELSPPKGLPETLIKALDTKLATAMGLASCAYLVGVRFAGGRNSHMLGFVDALPQAEGALASAAAEALTFSGIEAGAMDVAFFLSSDPVAARMERVGLRFDLPQLQHSVTQMRPPPGSDPENPPKLK